MRRAVLFDVDGTLVDTRDAHLNSWVAGFAAAGYEVKKEDVQPYFGRRSTEIVSAIAPEESKKVKDKVIEVKRRLFSRQLTGIKPIPKAPELIRYLKSKGVKVGLATSAVRGELEAHTRKLRVDSLVDAAVAGEEVDRSKPDPEIFQLLLEKLEIQPNEALVVGDSPHDMTAALKAGIEGICVTTGGYSTDNLFAAGAKLCFKHVGELYEALREADGNLDLLLDYHQAK